MVNFSGEWSVPIRMSFLAIYYQILICHCIYIILCTSTEYIQYTTVEYSIEMAAPSSLVYDDNDRAQSQDALPSDGEGDRSRNEAVDDAALLVCSFTTIMLGWRDMLTEV